MDIKTISEVFTAIGFIGVLAQTLIIPFVTKKLGDKKSLYLSLLFTALMFFGMALAKVQLIYVILTVGMALFNSFVNPLIQTLLSKEMDEASQGSIMGINASYVGLGSIFGPIAGGAIATLSLSAPFFLVSGIVLLCFLISTKIKISSTNPDHAF